MDNYVIICSNERHYFHTSSMKSMEAALGNAHFLRVHQSTIINTQNVTKLTNIQGQWQLVMHKGKHLPISRRKRSDIKTLLLKNR